VAPVEARIKWPNDIWIDGAKASGVLIEARPPDWAIVGIGVNVTIEPGEFPGDLRWPATSIGHGATVDELRLAISEALGAWVEAPEARTLAEFRRRDAIAGREVSWEGAAIDDGSGTAAGVDERGNLIVELEAGDRLSLGSGEVSLRLS
jgi:BirA family biotin operon repressor/biotin-[acetyl-CoA-carboxylase] ligase